MSEPFDLEFIDNRRRRVIPCRLYPASSEIASPVILVSHGLGGSRRGMSYLGKAWSSAGLHCLFLQHPGSDSDTIESAPPMKRFKAFKEAASLQNGLDRIADVSFVLDELEAEVRTPDRLAGLKFDLWRIGMAGHSFGAATSLAIAGRMYPSNQSYPDPRVKAFVTLSPQPVQTLSVDEAFGALKQPILCMTGTDDESPLTGKITPESRRDVYHAMPTGDKYLLVLDQANHFDFEERRRRRQPERDPRYHQAIHEIGLRFCQAYLWNDDSAKRWLQSRSPLEDNILVPADHWEWK
ncbi:MAG: acetylhydrolase [Pirellulaceae bacterium]